MLRPFILFIIRNITLRSPFMMNLDVRDSIIRIVVSWVSHFTPAPHAINDCGVDAGNIVLWVCHDNVFWVNVAIHADGTQC